MRETMTGCSVDPLEFKLWCTWTYTRYSAYFYFVCKDIIMCEIGKNPPVFSGTVFL